MKFVGQKGAENTGNKSRLEKGSQPIEKQVSHFCLFSHHWAHRGHPHLLWLHPCMWRAPTKACFASSATSCSEWEPRVPGQGRGKGPVFHCLPREWLELCVSSVGASIWRETWYLYQEKRGTTFVGQEGSPEKKEKEPLLCFDGFIFYVLRQCFIG